MDRQHKIEKSGWRGWVLAAALSLAAIGSAAALLQPAVQAQEPVASTQETGAQAGAQISAQAGAEEGDPTVSVQVAESDLDAIFAGTLPPPQAFKEGKIKLKGSVSTAMALLARVFI